MAEIIDMRQWERNRLAGIATRLIGVLLSASESDLTRKGRRFRDALLADNSKPE